MKKKIKIAAGFLTVIFCILLGCERREEASETLFLEEEADAVSSFEEQVDGEEIPPEPSGAEGSQKNGAGEAFAEERDSSASAEQEIDVGQSSAAPVSCVVHICGAVKEPGVYTLESGERIYQAIEKAGGFREDAQQDYLNQADLLSDGMKIYVPTQEEVREAGDTAKWTAVSAGEGASGQTAEAGKAEGGGDPALVNINTAGEEQLCTLPGVGSAKAKSIIAYRELNGAYRTIEEIMNVEGIKDGLFRKIKDSITV